MNRRTHFKSDTFNASYCANSHDFAVFATNNTPAGEVNTCTGCGEIEPEWHYLTPEEFADASELHW